MKIIILGCGKVGATLATMLDAEGHEITLIDRNARKLTELTSELDVAGVVGSGTNYTVQLEAGVEDADLLIAVTGQDEINLLCCLIAKKAGNCSTIARVRNPEYNAELTFIKEELGLSMTINPELAAAREISRLLRFTPAIKADSFAKGRVEMFQIRIPPHSVLHTMPLRDVRFRLMNDVLIAVVERGGKITIPNGDFILQEGDLISVIVPPEHAAALFKKVGIPNDHIHSVMIVGGGKIGYALASILIRSGISVKIIEQNSERCEFLSESLPQATIILGDGTDRRLLLEEGLKQVQCLACLTDFDEENVLLSLFGGQEAPGAKRITKVNRIQFQDVLEKLPLGSLIHPKEITAASILRYVRAMQNTLGSNVETLYKLHGAEALEFRVRPDFAYAQIPLMELNFKRNLLLACIARQRQIIIPSGRDVMLPGDTVIVVTTNTGLNDLSDIVEA